MMFHKRARVAAAFGVLGILAAGCIFSPKTGGGGGTTKSLLPRTSPENVINNIAACYELRSPADYDSNLAANYVFRFQEADILGGAPDSLTRGEEITFAENLFLNGKTESSPAASRIKFDFTISSHTDDNRIGHAGWKKYTVQTSLTINFPNGNDLKVDSPAEFYFKQEPDTSHWKLAEWKDLPGSSGAPTVLAQLRR